ncbi:Uncharacterized oxidoreductase At4g09670 [Linum grandiflorum]
MSEPKIRFGIIGCADIARKLARAISLSPNSHLSAVASRTLQKATDFAAANKLPPTVKIYGSYESLLDDPEIDAVYIPLPTSLHLEWAISAAERKKHVLLEKPVAVNVDELDRILAACEDNGVQFMDGTMWVHHPRTAKMKEVIDRKDEFGELRTVSDFSFYSVLLLLVMLCYAYHLFDEITLIVLFLLLRIVPYSSYEYDFRLGLEVDYRFDLKTLELSRSEKIICVNRTVNTDQLPR